jgi:hypothetical protein
VVAGGRGGVDCVGFLAWSSAALTRPWWSSELLVLVWPTEREFTVSYRDWVVAGLMLLCVVALAGCAVLLLQQGACV